MLNFKGHLEKTGFFSEKHTFTVCIGCLNGVLKPLCQARQTWHCCCISAVLKATYQAKLKAPDISTSPQKIPTRVPRHGICWKGWKRTIFSPISSHWFGKQMISFTRSKIQKKTGCSPFYDQFFLVYILPPFHLTCPIIVHRCTGNTISRKNSLHHNNS